MCFELKLMPVIEIKNLKKHFGKVKAVDGIDISVERGEIFGFLGPNGAGKTTAIRCMMDFIRPTATRLSSSKSCEIKLFGINSTAANFHLSREKIGYLIPAANLVGSWNGKDHFSYKESLFGKSKNLSDLIQRFDFNPKLKVKTLSTGNQQKLGLILALMNEPKLLIMDEPTVGLDPILQEEFYKILREFSAKDVAVFMSSHNLPEVEKICSRVAMIKSGKIVSVQKISALEGKKLHTVRVTFAEKVAENELADKDVEIIDQIDGGYILAVKHEIDPFIKKLAKFKIESISISQANLEEIFMEFYK